MYGKDFKYDSFITFFKNSRFEKSDKNNDGVLDKGEGSFNAKCDTNGDEELVFEEAMKCWVGFGVQQCNYYLLVRITTSRGMILMEMEP